MAPQQSKGHTDAQTWFSHSVLHGKEARLLGQMVDSRFGAWKEQDEPEASGDQKKSSKTKTPKWFKKKGGRGILIDGHSILIPRPVTMTLLGKKVSAGVTNYWNSVAHQKICFLQIWQKYRYNSDSFTPYSYYYVSCFHFFLWTI